MAALTAGACGGGGTVTGPSGVTPSEPIAVPPPRTGLCVAQQAQWAIGQAASSVLLERARAAAQAESARFLRPNQPITLEWNPLRLNLGLDRRDVVISATCG